MSLCRMVKFRVFGWPALLALVSIATADAAPTQTALSARTPMSFPGLTATSPALTQANAAVKPATRLRKPLGAGIKVQQLVRSPAAPFAGKLSSLMPNRAQALISPEQQTQLRDLVAQQGDQLQIHFDTQQGTPSYLAGRFAAAPGTLARGRDGRQASVGTFMNKHRSLFKLTDPAAELKLLREERDAGNRAHLVYQQTYKGVPIWGKQLIAHLNADNSLYLVNGRSVATPARINTTAKIDAAKALAVVLTALNAPKAEVLENELVIYTADDGSQTLAYRIDVRPTVLERWIYFVNAVSAEVVHKVQNAQAAGSVASAQGTDTLGATVSFNAWAENGKYYLIDPSYPLVHVPAAPLNAPDSKGDTYIMNAQNGDGSSLAFVSSNSANAGWENVAVSAMHNTRVVYDYYNNTHARNSIDGSGKNLLVMIHAGDKLANAFWTGTFMVYGDGDGQLLNQTASCLDVAGHEMTHGVIQETAGLIYENQSGALNESFADVFGTFVERNNWKMGEDCTAAAPGYLRNLEDPHLGASPQPAKMSEYENLPNTKDGDNGGVHVNSGIPNHAAYLAWQNLGGNEAAMQKLEQIYYKALTQYLAPSSLFVDARRATIQAATDLYGVSEVAAVTAAWDAVEVTDASVATPTTVGQTKVEEVSGTDVMLFLSPTDVAGTTKYELWKQYMADPITFDGPLNLPTVYANYTRPVEFTGQGGSVIFFVGEDQNLYAYAANDQGVFETTKLDGASNVWSIALSPDGRYFAYTTSDGTDKSIHVIDLSDESERAWTLSPPNYQQGSVDVANTIYYADSMSFDYTSKVLVFDALNCVSTPTNACNANQDGGYQFWSIGLLDVTNGDQFYPFPSQDPAVDIGFPAFAVNNAYTIAFDYIDYTDPLTPNSRVIFADMEKNSAAVIIDYGNIEQAGVASFWGDDSAVTVQYPSTDFSGAPALLPVGIPLKKDGSGDVESGIFLSEFASEMPVMHREGVRTASGSLQASAAMLDFGNVAVGGSKDVTLTLTNSSSQDINITGLAISGTGFTHNATNTLLPRSAKLDIRVSYTPVDTHPIVSTFTINTDSTPAKLEISLAANGGGKSTQASASSSSSKSGLGCTLGGTANDPTFIALLVLSIAALWRRKQQTRVSSH